MIVDLSDRHPGVQDIMKFFTYEHLEGELRDVSALCADLAARILDNVDDSAELTAGLRKLLEAKDCFVRAALTRKE